MLTPTLLIAYVGACFLFSLVPGPSVTVVLANSLSGGTRAGLLTILGTEISMLSMVFVVALGMEAIMTFVSEAFMVIKLAGAAYLIWIGWRMFTSGGALKIDQARSRKRARAYVLQGALVNWSNPKTLLFLGAFLPQFVNFSRPAFAQIMILGLIVMAVATFTDGLYAVAAGRARSLLTKERMKGLSRISGAILMVGGAWLAFLKRT
jgi:threonine/homoserine/homoserine lactone efflux protein